LGGAQPYGRKSLLVALELPLVDTLRGLEALQISESTFLDDREVLLASAMGGVLRCPGYVVLADFS
jgi:hypothetical protein